MTTTLDGTTRKYTLTKIAKGDYICSSNDGETLFRFIKYFDGPSSGLMDRGPDRDYWMVASAPLAVVADVDIETFSPLWKIQADACDTRKEAMAVVWEEYEAVP